MAWVENFEISTSGPQNQRSTSELHPDMEADASSNSASVGYKATVLPLKLIGHATLHGRVTM